MKSQRRHTNRSYRVSKRSIKDDYIDRQITVLHQAMAIKLLAHPEMLVKVHTTLETYRETGRLSYSGYITWLSLLELYQEKEQFVQRIIEDSAQMKRLRRITPLVGILTEAEREQALYADAIDLISDAESLFLA